MGLALIITWRTKKEVGINIKGGIKRKQIS